MRTLGREGRALAAGLGATLLLLPASVHAVRVEGFAIGTIDDAQTDANGATVFGLDADGLRGQGFRIDFVYDTSQAPAPVVFAPDANGTTRQQFASSDPAHDWLSMTITINGSTFAPRAEQRWADVLDQVPEPGFNRWDNLQLATQFQYTEPGGPGPYSVYREESISLDTPFSPDVLSSSDLPSGLAVPDVDVHHYSAYFNLAEYDQDPHTGPPSYSRIVTIFGVVDEIHASPVPEPGTAALLALGLAGLAARRRAL